MKKMELSRIVLFLVLGLVLTEQELVDTSGRLLTRIEDIHRVERGFLAFRPSHGFSLHLKTSQPRAWAPGLWWRFGRPIGVGGVISGAQGRVLLGDVGEQRREVLVGDRVVGVVVSRPQDPLGRRLVGQSDGDDVLVAPVQFVADGELRRRRRSLVCGRGGGRG